VTLLQMQVTAPRVPADPVMSRPVAVLLCCTWAQGQGMDPRGTTQVTGWPEACAMSS
jgi:hypothetical protein